MIQSIFEGREDADPADVAPPLAARRSVRAVTGQKNSSRSFMSPVKNTGRNGISARSRFTAAIWIRTASSRRCWAGPRASAGLWC